MLTSLSTVDLVIARTWLRHFGTDLINPRQFTELARTNAAISNTVDTAMAGFVGMHQHEAVKRWLYGREGLFFDLTEGSYRFARVGYRWRLVPRGERADALPTGPDPAELASAWLAAFRMAHVTIAEVIAYAKLHPELAKALVAVAPPSRPEDLCSSRRLGRWLVRHRGRTFHLDEGSAQFVMRDRREGHAIWQVFLDHAQLTDDLDEIIDTEVAAASL